MELNREEPSHRAPRGEAGASSPRRFAGQNLVAALICLLASVSFLWLALALTQGHSRGDTGPGALPTQVAAVAILVSLVYLVQSLRGRGLSGSAGVAEAPRVLLMIALFAAAALLADAVGFEVTLALAAALGTCLFFGERRSVRAVATGVGVWVIAHGLFGMLLGLPLP